MNNSSRTPLETAMTPGARCWLADPRTGRPSRLLPILHGLSAGLCALLLCGMPVQAQTAPPAPGIALVERPPDGHVEMMLSGSPGAALQQDALARSLPLLGEPQFSRNAGAGCGRPARSLCAGDGGMGVGLHEPAVPRPEFPPRRWICGRHRARTSRAFTTRISRAPRAASA